jgi:hypothetical protein
MKKRKKKKTSYVQTELQGLFGVNWELVSGPQIGWYHETTTGITNIPALTKEEAEEGFLKTYNIAGREFIVLSVTEILKRKQIHNNEHQEWDKIPT